MQNGDWSMVCDHCKKVAASYTQAKLDGWLFVGRFSTPAWKHACSPSCAAELAKVE